MAAAQHPHLATLHGLELWHGFPMMVMEYLDGGTLSQRLRKGPLSSAEAITLGAQLADALATLHRASLLHRDIKPSNIGYTATGVPKLLDFGLVKLLPLPPSATTHTGMGAESTWALSLSTEAGEIRGTPAYLSPEVLSGAPPSTGDDLWSLAITLLEACTTHNPFRAGTVAATVARVLGEQNRVTNLTATLSEPLQRLFSELLGPLAARPQTAHAFADRLRACRP
jgi:serine/threonine protein kinase